MRAEDTELDLGQYWQVLKRRWIPALLVFGGTATAITLMGVSQAKQYQADGKLRFKEQDSVSAFTGLEEDNRGQLKALNFKDSPIATEIGLMQTVPVIKETIEMMDWRNDDGELISHGQFLGSLSINNESGTDLLRVTYRSTEPEMAEAAVDALMTVYQQQHLLDNRAEAVAAREFIEQQLPDAERRALSAEAALRNFKERNQIVALEPETLATVTSLDEIAEQITEVNAQLSSAEAQFNTIQARIGKDPQSALVTTAISQAEGVQALLREYQEVEVALAAERVRFQDQHPTVIDLSNKLNNIESLLNQQISSVIGTQVLPSGISTGFNLQVGDVESSLVKEYLRLEASVNGLQEQALILEDAQLAYSSRASVLPQLEQEQNELERKLEAAQSTYSLLLRRLQEVRVAENQNVGNVRVVQPASLLAGPVSPNRRLYLAAGLMLGALLGISTAFLLETFDKSIKTVAQVRRHLNWPVLGVIPVFSGISYKPDGREPLGPELVIDDHNYSLPSESFHMLRSNLKFLNSDYPPQVIVVTSSVSGEGKSTVASNLAASIAQTGKQVLIIDADFRRPVQQWVWEVPRRDGLSDLLIDDASINETVQEISPRLMVLLAGSIPPNPAALLDSQKMTKLLQAFKTRFDYIIIDSPSISSGASASILGKMSDGLLLVVRPKVADVVGVDYAKDLIERSQQNMLGVVVNGALDKYEPYSYFLSEEFVDETTALPELPKNGYVSSSAPASKL